MNAARRKALTALVGQFEELTAAIEQHQSDENEALDNMPDSFRYGEKGDKAQAAVDALQEALDAIEQVIAAISTAAEE